MSFQNYKISWHEQDFQILPLKTRQKNWKIENVYVSQLFLVNSFIN